MLERLAAEHAWRWPKKTYLGTFGSTLVARHTSSSRVTDLTSEYIKCRFYITVSEPMRGSYTVESSGNVLITGYFTVNAGTHHLPILPIYGAKYSNVILTLDCDNVFELRYDEIALIKDCFYSGHFYQPIAYKLCDCKYSSKCALFIQRRLPLVRVVVVSDHALVNCTISINAHCIDMVASDEPDSYNEDNLCIQKISSSEHIYVFQCHMLNVTRYSTYFDFLFDNEGAFRIYVVAAQWAIYECGLMGPWR